MTLVCQGCGRGNADDALLCDQCGVPLKDSKCKDPCSRAQIVATLVASQDNTTWLAFTLGITAEVLLLIGFLTPEFDRAHLAAHLLIPVVGVYIAWVFGNLVKRSNGDLDALYARGENIASDAFRMPDRLRKGRKAGPLMMTSLNTWMVAWIIAFVAVLLVGAC